MAGAEIWALNASRLREASERAGLKALVLAGEPNIVYSTGLRGLAGAVVLSSECGDYIVSALLDYTRALEGAPRGFEVKAFYRGGEAGIKADVPASDLLEADSVASAVAKVLEACSGPVGVDLSWLPYQVAEQFKTVLGDRLRDFSGGVASIRAVKSEREVEAIERALEASYKAFERALEDLAEGVSELEVAAKITGGVMEAGAWGTSFPVIAAFYSNTALPHHSPGATRLSAPGPVLIDWGSVVDGYMSDTTRSLWWGSGGSNYRRLMEDVVEAMENAIDTAGPGVQASDVDRAARRTLEKRGLARYFIHGTGHGVGVEIHEKPYLRPASKDVLEPGMVVTIEPGVYMPGLYGVRVEDMVLITKRGRRVLTRLPRMLEL